MTLRRIARFTLLLWMIGSWALTGYILARHPFAQPLVERSAAEARVAFQVAMTRTVTADWLIPRLADATRNDRPDDITLYLDLAKEHHVSLPGALIAEAQDVVATHEGKLATAKDCAICAFDTTQCSSLTLIGACALPVEMSPVGDVAALGRAAVAAVKGDEVDTLDAGLALVGLAASGLVIVTGGESAVAKAGATFLRVGRKTRALSARMVDALWDMVRGLIHWNRIPAVLSRKAPLESAVDGVRMARLTAAAKDVGRIADNTSVGETLDLMQHADTVEDLGRIARVSDVAGKDTRKVMKVLGRDAFRLLLRVSDLAAAAIGLVALVLAQTVGMLAGFLRMTLRRLAREPRRRRPRGTVA